MQLANAILAIGGERDNTVPKYRITPAEVLLLRALHGGDAVTDIDVLAETKDVRSSEERERLYAFYARNTPEGRRCPELDALFPGVAARLPTAFDDIELDEVFYARKRGVAAAAPADAPAMAAETDPLGHNGSGRKGGSKKGGRAKKADAPGEPEPESDDDAADEGPENDSLFK